MLKNKVGDDQRIFNVGTDAKTVLGEKYKVMTGICYMAPADVARQWVIKHPQAVKRVYKRVVNTPNVCPRAGACREVCLNTAGRGVFNTVQQARIKKTISRFANRRAFIARASYEIMALQEKAAKRGMALAIRYNGTSDMPGDAIDLARAHSEVQFYDYTKICNTLDRTDLPKNYHLTLSYDPHTVPWEICKYYLRKGFNVAIVFDVKDGADLPKQIDGFDVISGDDSDLRFTDPKGVIVGLTAKGDAKRGTPEFVWRLEDTEANIGFAFDRAA